MCPADTAGVRMPRTDLCAIITANGIDVPDHSVIVNVDALQEKVDCVELGDLSLRLLSVGRRCKAHGFRFCWEPYAAEPTLQNSEGDFIPVECKTNSYVPHILRCSDMHHVHAFLGSPSRRLCQQAAGRRRAPARACARDPRSSLRGRAD